MRDERLQGREKPSGQGPNCFAMMDLLTVLPAHLQGSANDASIDREQMATRLQRTMSRACRATSRLPASLLTERRVELPQVVKFHLGLRQAGKRLGQVRVQIPQQSIP